MGQTHQYYIHIHYTRFSQRVTQECLLCAICSTISCATEQCVWSSPSYKKLREGMVVVAVCLCVSIATLPATHLVNVSEMRHYGIRCRLLYCMDIAFVFADSPISWHQHMIWQMHACMQVCNVHSCGSCQSTWFYWRLWLHAGNCAEGLHDSTSCKQKLVESVIMHMHVKVYWTCPCIVPHVGAPLWNLIVCFVIILYS